MKPSIAISIASLGCVLFAPSAGAVVYCKEVGIPKGCVARPVGAPGVGVRDPGINQPGAVGNIGVGAPGVGAPGVGARDPGINQPGAIGNTGPANRGGPVNRPGRF
ncbi:MAG: hypothetical protein FIB06_07910 [Betaproteobacteria bacterium]|nr:hypothetical protein [Betaproteobacteria bacterium]